MTLEVCAFSIQACKLAAEAGAVRIELCADPGNGGTTPSYGLIRIVREAVGIELYPIIRPRALDYRYTPDEWEIIKKEVYLCKELLCDGISVGVQLADGRLDADGIKRLVEYAYPMGVTCNRVFDHVPDPFEALEQLIEAGVERVLTSGQAPTAPEGAALLKKLVEASGGRISIMPGSGVRAANLEQLIQQTGAVEYHSSARLLMQLQTTGINTRVADAGVAYTADAEELRAMMNILSKHAANEPLQ